MLAGRARACVQGVCCVSVPFYLAFYLTLSVVGMQWAWQGNMVGVESEWARIHSAQVYQTLLTQAACAFRVS